MAGSCSLSWDFSSLSSNQAVLQANGVVVVEALFPVTHHAAQQGVGEVVEEEGDEDQRSQHNSWCWELEGCGKSDLDLAELFWPQFLPCAETTQSAHL